MSSLVVAQFGEAANAVGSHFWNLQYEHLQWAKMNKSNLQLDCLTFLNESSKGKFSPRCIVCDNTDGFGSINPQSGIISSSKVDFKQDNYNGVKIVQRPLSNDVNHWSYPFQYHFNPHSIFEVPCCHSVVNPIMNVVQCKNAFDRSDVLDLLEEKLRWQFEQCDSVGGVILLEDTSRGWDVSDSLRSYLREERVGSLFSIGLRNSSSPFNQTVTTFSALRNSSVFTSSNQCASLTACCLDSLLATCRQLDTRRQSLSELIQQFSLGESRSVLHMSYATEMLPAPPKDPRESKIENKEPLFNWKELEQPEHRVARTMRKEWMREELRTSRSISVVSRVMDWDMNRIIYRCNSTFYPNTIYNNLIVTDPLLLPRRSLKDLEKGEKEVYVKKQWYCAQLNTVMESETKNTDEARVSLIYRSSNEKDSIDVLGDPLYTIRSRESDLRYWLKTKCNENNRADEMDLMDLVDDCLEISERTEHDYLTM